MTTRTATQPTFASTASKAAGPHVAWCGLAVALAGLLAGCGPAAIGLGIGSISGDDTNTIGGPPEITTINVTSPDRGTNRNKPWLRVPIRLRVVNRFDREVRVFVSGRYQIDNVPADPSAAFPMTLRDDESATSTTFTLAPREQTERFVIWDVQADEGLGIGFGPGFPSQVARLNMQLSLLDAVGTVQEISDFFEPAPTTTLFTSPFVNFSNLLLRNETDSPLDVVQLTSSRRDQSNQTLDLFWSRPEIYPGQTSVLGTDQQFAPLPIPAPDSVQFTDISGAPTFIGFVLPTDFVPGLPDCLVNTSRAGMNFVSWNEDGTVNPPVLQPQGPVGNVASNQHMPGRRVVLHDSAGNPQGAALRVQFDQRIENGQRFLRVHPNVFIPNANGTIWTRHLPEGPVAATYERAIPDETPGLPPSLRGVLGEFDGDPLTVDYLVFSPGTEFSDPNAPEGWFHIISFAIDGSGGVNFREPTPIPIPPLIDGGSTPRSTTFTSWLIRLWPTSDNRPGVVLARRWPNQSAQTNLEYSLHVLAQDPNGGFAGQSWAPMDWEPVICPGRDPVNVPSDRGILCRESITGAGQAPFINELLPGDLDDDGKPELVVVWGKNDGASERLSVTLLANRANRAPVWRTVLDGLLPSDLDQNGTAFLKLAPGATQLVDLNGDAALDLLFKTEQAPNSGLLNGWTYFSSSLTGVGGDLLALPQSASLTESTRPAVDDLDKDGYMDILSGGTIHLGQPDGSYRQSQGTGLTWFPSTASRFEQIFDPNVDRSDQIEVTLSDRDQPVRSEVNQVVTFRTLTSGGFAVENRTPFDVPSGMAVVEAWPFLPKGRVGPGTSKDLALLTEPAGNPGASRALWRFHRVGNRFTSVSSTPLQDGLAVMGGRGSGGIAVVRRGMLEEDCDPSRNRIVQDIAFAADDPARVFVADSDNDYAPFLLISGLPGDTIEGIGAAEVTGDGHEDILVLVRNANTMQLYRAAQDPQTGFRGNVDIRKILEFREPTTFRGTPSLLGFAFDRNRGMLGQGIVMTNSEIRFVLPQGPGDALMVRSQVPPLPAGFQLSPLSLVLEDLDNDGLVDVVGGNEEGSLVQIERAFRSSR